MKFQFEFNISDQTFSFSASSDKPATMVDWILVLEDLSVQMKASFAKQISEKWSVRRGFTDAEKQSILGELDKMHGEHPNHVEHDRILNNVVMDLVEKLELKQDMEHLN